MNNRHHNDRGRHEHVHTIGIIMTVRDAHAGRQTDRANYCQKHGYTCALMEAASNADAAVRPLQTKLLGIVSATASTKAYIWSCGAVHARDLVAIDHVPGFLVGRVQGFFWRGNCFCLRIAVCAS